MPTIMDCRIVSVRADLVKDEVKITLAAKLTPELRNAVRMKLAWWSVAEMPIDVLMTELQNELPGLEGKEADGNES